jgi:hypothetical protein
MESCKAGNVLVTRLIVAGVFVVLMLSFMVSHEDIGLAQMTKAPLPTPNVFTPYDQPIGAVDTAGNVFALAGNQIGRVDADGSVYNVSKIMIGKVETDGKVKNQTGTVLCTVTADGKVYNVSGNLIGLVKDTGGNLTLIGGAARLLVLRHR